MRIGLDATYSVGSALTGVGVYSRELLNGLAASGFVEGWDWFYRSQRYWPAWRASRPRNVRRRFLADGFGDRSAALFHGLNQRLPVKKFKRQVATFHDLFVLTGQYSTAEFRARFALQARQAAERADLIIAVSEFTKRQVCELLQVDAGRVRVVHHGVLPRQLPQAVRENVVLCVGSIQKRKNQAALVRAFRALPKDWRLVLAGADGYGAEEIARSAGERVQVTGFLSEDELAGWYARARVFAFPSLDEGFGMPVLEAMAAGIPVITSNCSALPEVAGDAALPVDPHDDDQIAKALLTLAADENLRETLSARGKLHAARFTWDKAVQETLKVYEELS